MIFVTGDCHGNFERFKPKYFPEQAQMTKRDIVICAGDFGGVWFGDGRDEAALDWLESLPFTLAFVCGNHENYDALERYPVKDWHGGKVHRIRSHVLHLMRGQVFELEGYHFFTMGGAKSHDTEDGILEPGAPDFERKLLMLQRKPRARYRINHISWWAQEMPSEEEYAEARKNLAKVDWAVDYVITHCAPTSIALMENRHNEADPLTDFLQEVKERAHYHYWLFGHYHDNRAIDEKHILLWEQIVQVMFCTWKQNTDGNSVFWGDYSPNYESVMSTVLSRLNAFLDSELEQVLCFDSVIDAEKFASEKSAIFLILPEEDTTKNFMAGLMIQNLSRELFAVADENGGKLQNRVVLYCDEFGTMPPFDVLPLFSAGRSRRLTLVPIIQSLAQLEKNYGKEGSEIIQDNCQDTILAASHPTARRRRCCPRRSETAPFCLDR